MSIDYELIDSWSEDYKLYEQQEEHEKALRINNEVAWYALRMDKINPVGTYQRIISYYEHNKK